jgi:uncharacterized protein (TIGR00369 family)
MDDPTAFFHENMPFTRDLGVEVVELAPARVVVRAAWSPERCTAAGILHGGFIMAVADSSGAACASLNLPEGAVGTSTIESKTNFVGAVRDGSITATSEVVHAGSTTVVVQTDVRDDGGRLVTRTLQTQIVLRPR